MGETDFRTMRSVSSTKDSPLRWTETWWRGQVAVKPGWRELRAEKITRWTISHTEGPLELPCITPCREPGRMIRGLLDPEARGGKEALSGLP